MQHSQLLQWLAGGLTLAYLCFLPARFVSAETYQRAVGVRTDRPLSVSLDIHAGELTLVPGSIADSVYVIVRHSEPDHTPRVTYSEEESRLRVRIRSDSWGLGRSDRRGPRVRIELPTAPEIVLRSKMRAGELSVELGGLAVREAEFSIWAGEVVIRFSEPNRVVMSYFGLSPFVGETSVRRLGNARFEEASINGGIGELKVDFGGELLHEARAEIDLDIGETEIEVPGDVGVRLSTSRLWFLSQAELPDDYHRDGHFYYSANYDTAAKELLLRLKPGIGEARMVQQ